MPAGLIDGSAYPAVLDPLISPEIEPDAPVASIAADHQEYPAIACDGDLCLVTWIDTRPPMRIYAARVSAGGDVLDPSGLPVADLPGVNGSFLQYHRPQVAASGGLFLVVFAAPAGAEPPSGWGPPTQLRGARVTADGSVLDPGGFPITAAGPERWDRSPVVAPAGGSFLVFWSRSEPSSFVMRRARVAPDGAVLDPDGVPVAQEGEPRAIASGEAGAYLLWYGDGALRGSPLDAQGALLEPEGLALVPTDSGWMVTGALAWDGASYVAAWSLRPDRHVWATRITPAGAPLDPSPILVTSTLLDEVAGAASSGGTTFVLGVERDCGDDYCNDPYLHLARLGTGGAPLDPEAPLLSPLTDRASIAAGSSVLASWLGCESSLCTRALTGARLRPEGAAMEGSPFPLHWGVNDEHLPSAAFNGENHLVVWADNRQLSLDEPRAGIYGVRVSPAGEILDAPAITITTGVAGAPRAIFDGLRTVVFWPSDCYWDIGDCLSLKAARVGAGGEVLDAAPLSLPLGPWSLPTTTAAVGGGTLLVEVVSLSGDTLDPPALWRLDPGGALIGPAPMAGAEQIPDQHRIIGVVRGDAGYLLLLDDQEQSALFGARMSSDGAVLAPGVFPLLEPRPVSYSAAFVGTSYVVLATEYLEASSSFEVRAARVTAAGEPLDPPEGLLVAAYDQEASPGIAPGVAVAPTAEGALLAWSAPEGDAGEYVLHGAVLDGAGALGPVLPLAEEPGVHAPLALAADDQGGALLAYERQVESPSRADRVRLRVVSACGPEGCDPPDPPDAPDPCDAPGACGPAAEPDAPVRFGGCGCRIAAGAEPGGQAMLAAVALALLRRRRRARPDVR